MKTIRDHAENAQQYAQRRELIDIVGDRPYFIQTSGKGFSIRKIVFNGEFEEAKDFLLKAPPRRDRELDDAVIRPPPSRSPYAGGHGDIPLPPLAGLRRPS